MLFVVEGDAIVAPVLHTHPVHIHPPALGVILVHLRAAHFKLQTWGQNSLHLLLHSVVAPVSGA